MLPTLWFVIVAVMLAVYVVLDGFDLGTGIVHFGVGRNDAERHLMIRAIGPVWDGNEVWLISAAATLYCTFPALYASSFSGFYLPLMIVLWLLMLRGLAIEFRGQVDSPLWRPAWDAVFCGASAMLAIFFGTALGNVVRGVPLNRDGDFFLPLWTNFQPGERPGVLDWYTILIGVFAFLTLTMHGAVWLLLKLEGEMYERSRRIALTAFRLTVLIAIAASAASFRVQPHLSKRFGEAPAGLVFPLAAVAGLGGVWLFTTRRQDLQAFLSSSLFIVAMLASLVFSVYPMVLPATGDPELSLTIHNSAAHEYSLKAGLIWFIPGVLLVLVYFVYLYRRVSGKVNLVHNSH